MLLLSIDVLQVGLLCPSSSSSLANGQVSSASFSTNNIFHTSTYRIRRQGIIKFYDVFHARVTVSLNVT
jgi:hypothetical protein